MFMKHIPYEHIAQLTLSNIREILYKLVIMNKIVDYAPSL